MKKLFFLIIVLGNLWQATAEGNQPFKVGFILPLSGSLAEYGTAIKNALELQQSQAKEKSSITFLFEDYANDNTRAISAFNKLRNIDQVDLVDVWGYGAVQAVIPLAERVAFPIIANSAEPTIATGKQYAVRFNFSIIQCSDRIMRYTRSKGWRKLAIIKMEFPFMNDLYDGMMSQKQPDEQISLIASVNPSETDFRTVIGKIKKGKFDAVAVLLFPGQIESFYRQAHNLGLSLPSVGADPFDSNTVAAAAGEAINGAVFTTLFVSDKFRNDYNSKFGNDIQLPWAANAFDLADTITKLVKASPDRMTGKQLLYALRQPRKYQGASGDFSYVSDPRLGDGFIFSTVLKIVKENKIEMFDAMP